MTENFTKTDNTPQKPFDNNRVWWRCVVTGEAVVFGVLIFLALLRGLVYAIFGNLIAEYYVFYIFLPYLLPMFFWQIFQNVFYPGNACGMMVFSIPILASFVLWWIFLGVVLATIIYRVRLFLQNKPGNGEQSN